MAELKKVYFIRYEESMFQVAKLTYNLLDDLKDYPNTDILSELNKIVRFPKSYFQDMQKEDFSAFGANNAEVYEFEF